METYVKVFKRCLSKNINLSLQHVFKLASILIDHAIVNIISIPCDRMVKQQIGTVLLIASETPSQIIGSSSVSGRGKLGKAKISLARPTLVKEPDKYGGWWPSCTNIRKENRSPCSPIGQNNTKHFLWSIRSQYSLGCFEMVWWESVPRGSNVFSLTTRDCP